jgi:hypothetical protein
MVSTPAKYRDSAVATATTAAGRMFHANSPIDATVIASVIAI